MLPSRKTESFFAKERYGGVRKSRNQTVKSIDHTHSERNDRKRKHIHKIYRIEASSNTNLFSYRKREKKKPFENHRFDCVGNINTYIGEC